MNCSYHDASKMIDHALLMPTLTQDELEAGCRMAAAYEVASVCIMPYYVPRCAELLEGSGVLPSTVIGFPHGGQATSTKIAESEKAIADGAIELDMVINISAALSGQWQYITREIDEIVSLAHANQRKVKVIFENCYLGDDQKQRLCEICCELKADWIKTSTGFGTSGATMPDLELMLAKRTLPTQVKAAGGVRDLETLLKVRDMGVSRVGASATAAILDPAREHWDLEPLQANGDDQPTGY